MKRTFMFCLGTAFQAVMIITFFLSQAQAGTQNNHHQTHQNDTYLHQADNILEVQKETKRNEKEEIR